MTHKIEGQNEKDQEEKYHSQLAMPLEKEEEPHSVEKGGMTRRNIPGVR